ncbi:MAG: phenylalanine--tRNA ligase subunit alpha [Bdellovibrio sp.]|nr:phenylalanine--tRNA ligase subunit alpha [Bdellovibrio sp.]
MIEQKLNELYQKFKSELGGVKDRAAALNLKALYLGKQGPITEILANMKNLSIEERKIVGPIANGLKEKIQQDVEVSLQKFELDEINLSLSQSQNKIDLSLRDSLLAKVQNHGGAHPIWSIQREIEDVFLSMGFEIIDGPHIEDEYHNFEALNIPADHPARDMQDTFWFETEAKPGGFRHLLRTHTSTIQVRGMKQRRPPFRFIAPGKVFRCERTDASHEMVFHQLEGMLVDKNVSVAHLIYFMKTLLSEIFKRDVEVRLRPGFFPFVEPGFELDIKCLLCKGEGCSVCKQVGWVELLPCGMIHPNVLRAGDIDSREWNGFAFGLGLDRLVMMKYAIDDIRHIHSGDLRFVEQFKSY